MQFLEIRWSYKVDVVFPLILNGLQAKYYYKEQFMNNDVFGPYKTHMIKPFCEKIYFSSNCFCTKIPSQILKMSLHISKEGFKVNMINCKSSNIYWLGSPSRNLLNPFQTNVPFLNPLKTSERQRFSDVFSGYRKGTLA